MKWKRVCSVIAGVLNILFGLAFLTLMGISFAAIGNCFSWVSNGGDSGNQLAGAVALIFSGPFMLVGAVISAIVGLIPTIFHFICASTLFKANGKKERSTAFITIIMVFSVLELIGIIVFMIALIGDGETGAILPILIIGAIVVSGNFAVLLISRKMITEQNEEIYEKRRREFNENFRAGGFSGNFYGRDFNRESEHGESGDNGGSGGEQS